MSKGGYLATFQVLTGKLPPGGNRGGVITAAHRLYLKGRYFWGKRTVEGLAKSAEYYRRALAVDPAFGLAYLGIADCQLVSATFEFAAPAPLFAKATVAAESVLRQGTHLAAAHTTLACIKAFYQRDWSGAESGFQNALELDPGNAASWQWHGMSCLALGRVNEGLDALRTATERDPLSLMATTQCACGLYLTRRYAEAEEACGLALEMDPNFWPARYFLGLIYEQEAGPWPKPFANCGERRNYRKGTLFPSPAWPMPMLRRAARGMPEGSFKNSNRRGLRTCRPGRWPWFTRGWERVSKPSHYWPKALPIVRPSWRSS